MSRTSKGTQTIFWWVVWIVLTIAAFFVAAALWTPFIARVFGGVRDTKGAIIWVAAVFGTWLVFLVPLIIVMYRKVDRAYEDARMAREKSAMQFRSIFVDPSKRMLPEGLRHQLEGVPEIIAGGHLVDIILKDNRRFENVFIQDKKEIMGIYDQKTLPFDGSDISAIEISATKTLPNFLQSRWLRLDGVGI